MKFRCFCIMLICIFLTPSVAYADHISNCLFDIFFNNAEISNTNMKIIDGSVYVPLRWYSNIMGYNVKWHQDKQNVQISTYQYPEYKAVEVDGQYGYQDDNGNMIIEPKFNYAVDFSEGLGLVQYADKTFAYINLNGDAVIKNIYPYTNKFDDGVAIVMEYCDDLEQEYDDNYSYTDRDYRTYYIDKSGNMLFERYFIRAGEFNDGFAWVQIEGYGFPTPYEKKKYAYIDKTGNYVTDIIFEYAGDFKNGKAEVVKDGVKGSIDIGFNFTPAV